MQSLSDIDIKDKLHGDIFPKSCKISAFLLSRLSRLVGNQTMWFPNRSDTNRPVQAQKMA